MPRLEFHEYYLQMLDLLAKRGTCRRRQVGAIVIDARKRILSTGYNGVPSGLQHCIDVACPGAGDVPGDSRKCFAIHAEINALMQCSRLDLAHTLYSTCTPCFDCAKAISTTPIQHVIFREMYADERGARLLEACGRTVTMIPRAEPLSR